MKKLTILITFIILACASCTVDPRKSAEAYQTIQQSNSQAAKDSQERRFKEDQHKADMLDEQATRQTRQEAKNRVINTLGLVGVFVIVSTGVSTAIAYAFGAIGTGKAVSKATQFRATFIPLSAATRQFPALIQYIGKGRFALLNPNTGEVKMLDTNHPADRQMVLNSGAINLAGVIAHAAKHSDSPEGFSAFTVPVLPILTGKEDSHEEE